MTTIYALHIPRCSLVKGCSYLDGNATFDKLVEHPNFAKFKTLRERFSPHGYDDITFEFQVDDDEDHLALQKAKELCHKAAKELHAALLETLSYKEVQDLSAFWGNCLVSLATSPLVSAYISLL